MKTRTPPAMIGLTLTLLLAGGCATRPAADGRPSLDLPPRSPTASPTAPLDTRQGTGIDARTIDDTGSAPDGPVTPAGSSPGASRTGGGGAGGTVGPAGPMLFASVDGEAAPDADLAPDAEPAGYKTVGGVLAEVNGRAIYTDQVIAARRPELRGLALKLPKNKFLQEAARVLSDEVSLRMRDEQMRVLAEQNLRPEDRRRAVLLATQWRARQITDAGGSEAVARERALADNGLGFEQLGDDAYAKFVGLLFRQTILEPRATPSADQVRDYFRRHREEFGSKGKLAFLLVEIDAAREPEKAMLKARHVRDLAAGGEDFETLAKSYNDNPFYRRSGGRLASPEPLPKGGVAWPELEAALWETPVGGVTPVVAVRDGRSLLVAKVLEKEEPKAGDFADAQDAITGLIRGRRLQEMNGDLLGDIRRYAAVTPQEQVEKAMRTAMEVVSQEYDELKKGT